MVILPLPMMSSKKHTRDLAITQRVRQTLEYGESREGYWSCDKFMLEMEVGADIKLLEYTSTYLYVLYTCVLTFCTVLYLCV